MRENIREGIRENIKEDIKENIKEDINKNRQENLQKDAITILRKGDRGYPGRLTNLEGMPEKLYVIGQLPDERRPSIAIVGARECSFYGKNMAYEYAKILGEQGIQIISGLARGVDAAAHAGALAAGGQTYGILGCGVDVCYPASSRKIYEKMKVSGGIISEFEPASAPLAYHFPMRNRLISGFADAVLVVEARERSGSLITADFALEQGRTVFAVPGRAGDLLSEGCNRLIYQGAVPAWKPQIVLDEMNWDRRKPENNPLLGEKKSLGLATEDELVYSCLDLNPKMLEQIQEETGLSSGRLLTSLVRLEMAGLVKEVWKNNYVSVKNNNK
jgi:DNA processing protein